MHYDIVSFDLDGTLVDTAGEIAEAANRALEVHGITRRPVAEIERLIGAGARELMLKLLARIYIDDPALADRVRVDDVLASFDEHYAETAGSTARPYDGAGLALARLKAAGVRLACVTNKETRHTLRVLQALALDDCFELIVGGDTLPHKKPHASVLRHVVEMFGGDVQRAAHVGDSQTDIDAARNAGVAAWAVPYGYNAGVPVQACAPERVFSDLDEVASHVLAGRLAWSAGAC